MNQLKRTLFQVLAWLGIWCMVWISSGGDIQFIKTNSLAFVLQIVLLFGLIYVAVPQFLFKKKYLYFLVSTILAILLCAYISAELAPPPIDKPPLDKLGRPPGNVPSRFFVHLLILSISCISAVLLETFVFAQQKEKSTAIAKAELLESELKFLKMQINPHFLFNALNNIYALSTIDTVKTQESISDLSNMLRYVLYECERPFVRVQKELDYINDYIKLFELKSSKICPIETYFAISNGTAEIAPMLLIPFVENAFKHSNIEKVEQVFIKIYVDTNQDEITFKIENTVPNNSIVKDDVGGIGLENVKKRLSILYPERHKLKISEINNVFKVQLNLKING